MEIANSGVANSENLIIGGGGGAQVHIFGQTI